MKSGFIFVLINPYMENIVKIGKTTRTSEERAKELSSDSAVPTKFIVVYEIACENIGRVESFILDYLTKKGFKIADSRDFFKMPIKEAVNALIYAKEHFKEVKIEPEVEKTQKQEVDPSWEKSLNLGDNYYYGFDGFEVDKEVAFQHYYNAYHKGSAEATMKIGDFYNYGDEGVFQNEAQALDFYEIAYKRGCPKVVSKIGDIYFYGGTGVTKNSKLALNYFQECIENGEVKCYANRAKVFADIGNSTVNKLEMSDKNRIEEAQKNWELYIDKAEPFNSSHSFDFFILEYVDFININGLSFQNRVRLKNYKKIIEQAFNGKIHRFRNSEFESLIPVFEKNLEFFLSEIE